MWLGRVSGAAVFAGALVAATGLGLSAVQSAAPQEVPTWDTKGFFTTVSVGGEHTCALDKVGKAWCWGSDLNGQLGDGSANNNGTADDLSSEPVPVAGGLTFREIATGGRHTCALDVDSAAWCWGEDGFGQVGNGSRGNKKKHVGEVEYEPVRVDDEGGALRFRSIDAGWDHTCGVDKKGRAWCWGSDMWGQLGEGDVDNDYVYSPVRTVTIARFRTVSAGYNHTCGLDQTDQVWCWGLDSDGQIGDGAKNNKFKLDTQWRNSSTHWPKLVSGLKNEYSQVSAGGFHTCALDLQGLAWCWGSDANGEMGDGSTNNTGDFRSDHNFAPFLVGDGRNYVDIAAGVGHTCGLDADGVAWCWGLDEFGEVGSGISTPAAESSRIVYGPIQVVGNERYSDLSAGGYSTCGISPSSYPAAKTGLLCWGDDVYGQLGDGSSGGSGKAVPVKVQSPK